jgi:hypothetical protein
VNPVDRSAYEISGDGWSGLFERWLPDEPADDVSPHRGALPFHSLTGSSPDRVVVVPLRETEALWVAFTLRSDMALFGQTPDGRGLNRSVLAELGDCSRIEIADTVSDQDGAASPIRQASVGVARFARDLTSPHLMFRISASGKEISRLGVVLATPRLYARVSGRPPPEPSSPDDAYRGWRLP